MYLSKGYLLHCINVDIRGDDVEIIDLLFP